MVVFRLRGENELTEKVKVFELSNDFIKFIFISSFFYKLLKRLNHRGNLHAVPASLKGKYVIRFTVTSTHTTNDDIIKDWNEIRLVASEICEECKDKMEKRVPLKGKKIIFLLPITSRQEMHSSKHHFREKFETKSIFFCYYVSVNYLSLSDDDDDDYCLKFAWIHHLQQKKNNFFFFLTDIREKNEAFGSSLLLANSPMSPKVVNGSFAAIIDADEFLAKAYAGIRIAVRYFLF